MNEKKNRDEIVCCPVGEFFSDLENTFGKKSKFFKHMNQSRIEFLRAIRALVDEGIEALENKGSPKRGKKATKIKVE